MLKIKDNVDLKELEKYGFGRNYPTTDLYVCRIFNEKDYCYVIRINNRTRKMNVGIAMDGNISTVKNIDECSDILFDLIQVGLVEKVAD